MKEIIQDLTSNISDIIIKKGLFSTRLFYKGTAELKQYTIYFGANDASALRDFFNTGRIKDLEKMSTVSDGPNKIEIFIARDDSFAAIKLFQFVPYTYEPRSDWFKITAPLDCQVLRYLIGQHN